jgi:hypothetical protein
MRMRKILFSAVNLAFDRYDSHPVSATGLLYHGHLKSEL